MGGEVDSFNPGGRWNQIKNGPAVFRECWCLQLKCALLKLFPRRGRRHRSLRMNRNGFSSFHVKYRFACFSQERLTNRTFKKKKERLCFFHSDEIARQLPTTNTATHKNNLMCADNGGVWRRVGETLGSLFQRSLNEVPPSLQTVFRPECHNVSFPLTFRDGYRSLKPRVRQAPAGVSASVKTQNGCQKKVRRGKRHAEGTPQWEKMEDEERSNVKSESCSSCLRPTLYSFLVYFPFSNDTMRHSSPSACMWLTRESSLSGVFHPNQRSDARSHAERDLKEREIQPVFGARRGGPGWRRILCGSRALQELRRKASEGTEAGVNSSWRQNRGSRRHMRRVQDVCFVLVVVHISKPPRRCVSAALNWSHLLSLVDLGQSWQKKKERKKEKSHHWMTNKLVF